MDIARRSYILITSSSSSVKPMRALTEAKGTWPFTHEVQGIS